MLIRCGAATRRMDRIRISIQNYKFTGVLKDTTITISGGIAYRRKNETLTDFLHRADTALYEAKESGRNKISIIQNK